jgi:hypothetical protein
VGKSDIQRVGSLTARLSIKEMGASNDQAAEEKDGKRAGDCSTKKRILEDCEAIESEIGRTEDELGLPHSSSSEPWDHCFLRIEIARGW